MRREKGQAIILVLIVLGLGALVISPTLKYASTGLKAYQIGQQRMQEEYAADAATENAIWRLKYNVNGFTDLFVNETSPSQNYQLAINGKSVSVTVGLPAPPAAQPTSSQGFLSVTANRSPLWTKASGGVTITYTITLYNNTGVAKDINGIEYVLPPGFTYVANSASTFPGNISLAEPTLSYPPEEGGKQKVVWSFTSPYPKIPKKSGGTPGQASQKFNVQASSDGGIYYCKPVAKVDAGFAVPFSLGASSPVWVGVYYITAVSGQVTLKTCVTVRQNGVVKVYNWRRQ